MTNVENAAEIFNIQKLRAMQQLLLRERKTYLSSRVFLLKNSTSLKNLRVGPAKKFWMLLVKSGISSRPGIIEI